MRWPLQPLQPLQKAQLQPRFGPSVDSLCHPCITTTHLPYIFETSATALCGTTGIYIHIWQWGKIVPGIYSLTHSDMMLLYVYYDYMLLLPSGCNKKLWKILIFKGKTTYKWSFSIAMWLFTRGYDTYWYVHISIGLRAGWSSSVSEGTSFFDKTCGLMACNKGKPAKLRPSLWKSEMSEMSMSYYTHHYPLVIIYPSSNLWVIIPI